MSQRILKVDDVPASGSSDETVLGPKLSPMDPTIPIAHIFGTVGSGKSTVVTALRSLLGHGVAGARFSQRTTPSQPMDEQYTRMANGLFPIRTPPTRGDG